MHSFVFIAVLLLGHTLAAGFRLTQPDNLPLGVTIAPVRFATSHLYDVIDTCFRKLCPPNILTEVCLWNCVTNSADRASFQQWINIFRYLYSCGDSFCRKPDGSLDENCLKIKCDEKILTRRSIPPAEGATNIKCDQCGYLPEMFHRDCVERFCQNEPASVGKRGWESGHHLLGKVLHDRCDSSADFVACVQALVQNYRRKRRHANVTA